MELGDCAAVAVYQGTVRQSMNGAGSMKLKQTLIQFIKFGIVGLSNTLISYLVYVGLVYFGLYYVFANIVGFVVSVLNSFYWNNKYVFKTNEDSRRCWWRALIKTFMSYAFSGLVLSNVLLVVWVDLLHIPVYLAPLISLIITIPLNYLMNRYWAFK